MEKHELMIPKGRMTFDEFREIMAESEESASAIDKVSDLYDKVPAWVRTIQNFDPTGIAGAIDQILSDNKTKRQEECLLKALYSFYEAIIILNERQIKSDKFVKEHLAELTYLYFEKSKETYDSRKINYYKSIWINGIVGTKDTIEEKIYVFNIVASLSIDELTILRLMDEKQGNHNFMQREPVSIKEISSQLEFSIELSQQLCIALIGKGLLYDWGIGRMDYEGPVSFVVTDYVKLISKYLVDA